MTYSWTCKNGHENESDSWCEGFQEYDDQFECGVEGCGDIHTADYKDLEDIHTDYCVDMADTLREMAG